MNSYNKKIYLSIFNRYILAQVNSEDLYKMINHVYGAMITHKPKCEPHLSYILIKIDLDHMSITREGDSSKYFASSLSELLFLFEKDMTIELQKIRSDLLFIHSAALTIDGEAILLVAPSGTGKSTTAWAMINSGFSYLSDELAPIDLNSLTVMPYPHALCLKAIPPIFKLPDDTLYTSHTIHVPINEFCDNNVRPLKAIFYLEFNAESVKPEIHRVTTAEAAANLYANSLNILAHGENDSGLNVAIKVAGQVNNYKLKSNDLEKTCKEIKLLMNTI